MSITRLTTVTDLAIREKLTYAQALAKALRGVFGPVERRGSRLFVRVAEPAARGETMTTTPQTPADEALGNGDGRMADAQQGPLRNPTS
jgi:uncharacterized membrane protein (UPF0182 family)